MEQNMYMLMLFKSTNGNQIKLSNIRTVEEVEFDETIEESPRTTEN